MIIGIAQIDIVWEDCTENMKKIEELVNKASENKVELILFPEMSLTGFTMDINKLLLSEEQIISWIKQVAVNNYINIGLGFAIKVDEKGKNKYVIVSKDGKILTIYTKIHPFSYSGEDNKYYSGNEICICKIKEFQITPFICYDLRFPEIFQMASKEAQIITVAASWPKSREEHWITLLKARAIENQCYIIGINRVGLGDYLQYNGASIFVSPSGEVLNEINSEEMLIIKDLEIEKIKEVKDSFDIKKDRREDLYR
ncbi:amidohydrolase [Clostridium gelidum]|uniref:Amidohydrolase n=1 Tax=Clostridium gelidum TaxID=704125 RepID=A0ABM7TLR0_9CLOT|nr:nitrilase-related carbon-nitrogen hydrolase [Clostridium gelidum]BCZ49098.1 amidohydrolase [Clostridium gelidum]